MTSLQPAPAMGDELPSQQIARRIRGILAERQITGTAAATALDLDQRAFSRRYRGVVPWSIDELSQLAMSLGVPFEELVRHQGLEPRTRWFAATPATPVTLASAPDPGGTQELDEHAVVLPFRRPASPRSRRVLGRSA